MKLLGKGVENDAKFCDVTSTEVSKTSFYGKKKLKRFYETEINYGLIYVCIACWKILDQFFFRRAIQASTSLCLVVLFGTTVWIYFCKKIGAFLEIYMG